MNNLKFRVFDKINWCWLTEEVYLNLNTGNVFIWAGFDIIDLEPKRIDIHVYTGLKDKAGKEIFESDIVKIRYANVGDKVKEKLAIVKYNYEKKAMFSAVLFNDEDFFLLQNKNCNDDYYLSFKVIGNIYDNPELIEEVK